MDVSVVVLFLLDEHAAIGTTAAPAAGAALIRAISECLRPHGDCYE
ncbi:MAG: hypothetical protein QOH14_1741, partial [Pseudonocardiales bacterium]|nr:hypothetical protein [Pseudonocardiales bacterium]